MGMNPPERAWKAGRRMDNIRRMDPRLRNVIVYGIIVSWTAFPIVCVLVVMAVSAICGCTVNESSPLPCVVFGVDIGRGLYILGVMGWLGIVTLPSGGIAFALYTVFVVAELLISRRKK
jgi:hypothetical protein